MLVLVKKVISSRPWGMIFSAVLEENHDCSLQVKAYSHSLPDRPARDELWEIQGETSNTRWGKQISASHCRRIRSSGAQLISFLSDRCPGIGPTRAKRLWDKWGDDLPIVLDKGNILEIADVVAPDRPLLSLRLSSYILSAWQSSQNEAKLACWLQQKGLYHPKLPLLLATVFPKNAIDRLSENPWCLSSIAPWKIVDEIGLQLVANGIKCEKRLLGAVDSVVLDFLKSGHTAISQDTLIECLTHKIYSKSLATKALEIGFAYGAIIKANEYGILSNDDFSLLRFPGAAAMEEEVLQALKRISVGRIEDFAPNKDACASILEELERNGTIRKLDDEQRSVVLHILGKKFSVLAGGAGTGKTTSLRAIVRVWNRLGGNVLMATLSGKAALRLSQTTGLLAKTICKTIYELEERKNSDKIINDNFAKATPKTLVVIDEASLVDLTSFFKLLKLLPTGARLLLSGDESQLPPIGFGLVFHKLVKDENLTKRLTTIYRQKAESGIPMVSIALRTKQPPALDEYRGKSSGVSFIQASEGELRDIIEKIFIDLGGLEARGDLLIVTATNKGSAGVCRLNNIFHKKYQLATNFQELKGYFGQCFCQGEPVIHLRNDYSRGIFNGSTGWVQDITIDNHSLVANFDGKEVEFDASNLIDLALAYSVTCHKAQGSQVKRVIIPLYKTHVTDLSWLYTSLTRAERPVVIVGDRRLFDSILTKQFSAELRSVGFVWS